jgi:hypothetical protein
VTAELSSRSRDLVEVAAVYVLVLIALWTPNDVQRVLFWLILALVVGLTFWPRDRRREPLGLSMSGLRRSLWVVLVAVLLAAGTLWTAQKLGTLHLPLHLSPFGLRTCSYLAWSLLQQFLLQDFFLARLLRVFSSRITAVVVAAVLFASAHVPNPVLVPATLAWGLIACALFLRYHDLLSLGIVHAILGITLAMSIPNAVHHQMRVGLGYFQYHEPSHALYRNQSSQIVSTEAWVTAEAISLRSWRHARP